MQPILEDTQALIRSSIQKLAKTELMELSEFLLRNPGKLNRPYAIELLATALGAQDGVKEEQRESLISWAAAVELFHTGSLVHDDLQDGDRYRRGAPSLWSVKGKNRAMNCGTFMILGGLNCLKDERLSSLLIQAGSDALEGQCREEALNRLASLRGLRQLYFDVCELKTASLFQVIGEGVGILCNLEPDELKKLSLCFKELGILFQLQDDILDLYGKKGRDMQGNDIKEGKVSFLILKHLELYHYEHETIKKLLGRGRKNIQRGDILILKEQFLVDGTLGVALEEFIERCYALMDSTYLNDNPRVGACFLELIDKMMKPLSHLSEIEDFSKQALSRPMVRQGIMV